MNKETVEKAINLSKDINALKDFITSIKTENSSILGILRTHYLLEPYYEKLNISSNRYKEIIKEFVILLETKLQQLEKELEDL